MQAALPALLALAEGNRAAIKSALEDAAEDVVRKNLPPELRKIGLDVLKKGNFRGVVDDVVADAQAKLRKKIDNAAADAIPTDALGGVGLAALEQLVATGNFAKFVENQARKRVKRFVAERLARLAVKINSGGIVIQIATEVLVKIIGPKLKEALRFKGKLSRRTNITIKGFDNRAKDLARLREKSDPDKVRRYIENAQRALAMTKYLEGDLRRAGETGLLAKLQAAADRLRSVLRAVRKRHGLDDSVLQSRLNGIINSVSSNVADITSITDGLRGGPAGDPWHGTWSTNFGMMYLRQTGGSVTGCYSHDAGNIDGSGSSTMVSGTWTELPTRAGPTDAGSFTFTLMDNNTRFEGPWDYVSSTSPAGTWTGTRAGDYPADDPCSKPPYTD